MMRTSPPRVRLGHDPHNEKTQMLFGDAKASVSEITSELGAL